MRYIWILEGDVPNVPRLREQGINGLYFDPRDPNTTKAKLLDYRAQGFAVGMYGAWNWAEAGDTGEEFAEWMQAMVVPLTDGRKDQPRVQFDIEAHDPNYVGDCLVRFRTLEPGRAMSWTMESFQGGWMDDPLIAVIKMTRTRLAPQYYYGDMSVVAQDRAMVDLLNRGIHHRGISGMYDAAALPAAWDGFAFHQGRLP
jgi:hypothetical protein